MAVIPESGSSLHLQASFLLPPPPFRMHWVGYGLLWVVSLDTSGMNPLNSHDKTDIVICLPTLPHESLLLCSSGSLFSPKMYDRIEIMSLSCLHLSVTHHLALAMEALCGLTPAFLCVLLPQPFLLIPLAALALLVFSLYLPCCYLRTFPHADLIAWNPFLTFCLTHLSCNSQLTYQYLPEGSPLAPPLSQVALHH